MYHPMIRSGHTVLVVFVLLLLSSSVDSNQGENTHDKRALYAQPTTDQLEANNFITTYNLEADGSDKRNLRGGATSRSDDESVDSVTNVDVPPAQVTEQETAEGGPEQIGNHFTIRISSDYDASQIQPHVSIVGKTGDRRWVYHLCHPGASFINVHFADLGKLRFCQLPNSRSINDNKTTHVHFWFLDLGKSCFGKMHFSLKLSS
jgi:hypothetical protein